MSPEEFIYRKILKDVERYITEDRLKNKINYVFCFGRIPKRRLPFFTKNC